MPDKLSTFLVPFSAFQTIQLSSHPAGHPSQQPHALIAAYGGRDGTLDGLDEISCIVQSSPLSSSFSSLSFRSIPEKERAEEYIPSNLPGLCIRREIERYWGKEFSSFTSPPLRPSSFSFNVQFYFSFHVNEHQAILHGRTHR